MEVQGVGIGYTLPSRGTWLRFIYNPLITHMVSRGATEPDPASIHSGPSDFREGIAWTSMLKPLETPGGGGGSGGGGQNMLFEPGTMDRIRTTSESF